MKKRNKFLFLATLSTACLLSLASCQGAQGPKGDQGTPGINGTNGTNGQDGKNGSSVLTGKGAPASTLGNDGDSYIDTDTFDFYSKSSGTWLKIGNIKGSTGDQGQAGEQGETGEKGKSLLTGSGVPSSELGNDGDSYIDLDTFEFYSKAEGTWSKYGNIKGSDGSKGDAGEAGEEGKKGSSVLTGKGEPASTLGNDGDSYIDTTSFDFYTKTEGVWSKVGNIKGEKGDQGDKGDKGNSGWSGSKGDKGDTAYSNTILPSTGGYVTVDVGSAIVGTKVTFTAVPDEDDDYELVALKIESADGFSDSTCDSTLTTTMRAGGFVVSATFTKDAEANKSKNTVKGNNKLYDTVNDAIKDGCNNIKLEKDTTLAKSINIPADRSLTINLNGHTLNCGGCQFGVLGSLYVSNNGEAAEKITGENSSGIILVNNEIANADEVKNASSLRLDNKFNTISLMSNSLRTSTSGNLVSIGDNVIFKLASGATAIKSTGSNATINISEKAEFQGTDESTSFKAIEVSEGSATITGSVKTSSGTAVTVSGGEVDVKATVEASGTAKAVEVSGSTTQVTVSGSVTSESGNAVQVKGGSLTVGSSASISSSTGSAVEVSGTETKVTVSGSVASTSGSAVKVSGGSITVEKSASVISDSGSAVEVSGSSSLVTVSGNVTSSSGTAVKVSNGTVTVSGGTVSSTTGNAIEVTGQGKYDFDSSTYGGLTYDSEGNLEISNAAGLKSFRDLVNSGVKFENKTIKLTKDINLNGEEWKPITGNFRGTNMIFDGNGKTITNFKIEQNYMTYDTIEGAAGFFSDVRGLTVKNLTIDNANITGYHYSGVLVGYAYDLDISNCHVKNSSVTGKFKETSSGGYDYCDKIGGIVGYVTVNSGSASKIDSCTVSNVTLSGFRDVGGIAGYAGSTTTVTNNALKGNIKFICDRTQTYENKEKWLNFNDIIGRNEANADVTSNSVSDATITREEKGSN